jgi:hypothetical protein
MCSLSYVLILRAIIISPHYVTARCLVILNDNYLNTVSG